MKNNYKKIGIIGGMGPEAMTDLYMKIVNYFQENFGAKYDRDFPEFFLHSVPVPDVVESLENESETLRMLSDSAKKLQKNGCDFIVIACNSVQFLLEQIRKSVSISVVGIAQANAEYIHQKGLKKIGILATKTTIGRNVYDEDFEKFGISLVRPNDKDQKIVTEVIMTQLARKITPKDKSALISVIGNLKKEGAEAILLACTDLPLVIQKTDIGIPLIDCNEIYAKKSGKLASNC
jgi:aspartate racemase